MKKVYVELTSRCNLSCTMCFRRNWIGEKTGDMRAETEERLVESLNDPAVECVLFGGMGEPLLYPQIAILTARLTTMGKKVELLTNGTLLSAAVSRALLDAGLRRLWISMDGFSREAYEAVRLGSQFDAICENLRSFDRLRAQTGAELGITFVMMPENLHELPNINAFADRFHAEWLNLSHVIPGEALPEERALYRQVLPVGKMHRAEPPYVQHPHDRCPFVAGEQVFVRWDGDVAPCMQLLHTSYTYLYSLRRTVYRHSFGNIREQTLRTIWEKPEYVRFRRQVKEFYFPNCTECLGCEDREENRKDCLYNEKPTCGACLWATGKVFCP